MSRKRVDVSGYDRNREGREETVRPYTREQEVGSDSGAPSGVSMRRPHAPPRRPANAYRYLVVRTEKRAEEIASGIRELHPFAYVEITPGPGGTAEVWTDVDEWRRGRAETGQVLDSKGVVVAAMDARTGRMEYAPGVASLLEESPSERAAAGRRLLSVSKKADGYYVDSRDERAFDWRGESGPFPSSAAAYSDAARIAAAKGWAIQVPGAASESIIRGLYGSGRA